MADVQGQINGLPGAEELSSMTLEEQQAVYNQLQAAYDAYTTLTDEQKGKITGAEIFDSLFAVFNGMTNTLDGENPLDGETSPVTIGGTNLLNDTYYVVDSNGVLTTVGADSGNYDAYYKSTDENLTLDGLNFTGSTNFDIKQSDYITYHNTAAIYVNGDVTLELIGTNAVTNNATSSEDNSYGLYVTGTLTVGGDGSLTATAGAASGKEGSESFGVRATNITVNSGTLSGTGGAVTGGASESVGVYVDGQENSGSRLSVSGTVIGTGGDLEASNSGRSTHGVYVQWSEIEVTGGTLTGTGGTITGTGSYCHSYGVRTNGNNLTSGNISVTDGGTLTGKGQSSSAGSSCGVSAENDSNNAKITISGSTLIAQCASGSCLYGTLNASGSMWRASSTGAYTNTGTIPTTGTYLELRPYAASSTRLQVMSGTSAVNSAVYGSTVTLTATVTDGNSNPVTGGSVTFYQGDAATGAQIGNAIVNENGTATYNLTLTGDNWPASATAYTITAVYSGDTLMGSSNTAQLTVTQSGSSLTTTVKNGDTVTNNFTYGDTITVEVTPSATGLAPTANGINLLTTEQNTVELIYDGNVIATATSPDGKGTYTLSYNTTDKKIPVGNNISLTVSYGGSSSMAANTAPVTVNLSQKSVSASLTGTTTKTYDGTTNPPEGLTITLSGVEDNDNVTASGTIDYNSANVGEAATITASNIALGGNDSGYYSLSNTTASATGSISAAAITGRVTITGTAQYGQQLAAGYTGSESVSYQWKRDNTAISNATGSTYTLTADDIGQTISVTVSGTGNYTGSVSDSTKDTVQKATGRIEISCGDVVYGNPVTVTVNQNTNTGAAVKYSYSGTGSTQYGPSEEAPAGVGTYSVTATVAETSTHTSAMDTVTFSITQSGSSLTATVKNDGTTTNNFTYGDTITVEVEPSATGQAPEANGILGRRGTMDEGQSATAQNTVELRTSDGDVLAAADTADTNGTYTLTYDTAEKGLPIGENTLTVIYAGSDSLAAAETNVKVTLAKKSVAASVEGDVSKPYDTTTAITVNLTVMSGLETDDSVTGTVSGHFDTADVGTEKTVALGTPSWSGDGAWYNIALPTVTGSITQAGLKGSVTITGSAVYSENLTAAYESSVESETVAYQWYRDGEAISGATDNNYQLTADDIGKTISVTVSGTGSYTGEVTASITGTVQKAPGSIEISCNSTVYGGDPVDPQVTNTINEGADVTYSYVGTGSTTYGPSSTAPAAVGTYSVTATVAETSTHTSAMDTVTFSITQSGSSLTVTVKNGESVTNDFAYGDTIIIQVVPSATGQALAANGILGRRGTMDEGLRTPTQNTVELRTSEGDVLAVADTADTNGTYTLTYDTTGKDLTIGINVLTVCYGGSNSLAASTADVTINLRAKTVTAQLGGTVTKTYDGTVNPPDGLTIRLTGSEIGDDVEASGTIAYNSPNVNEASAINADNIILIGDDAEYYTLSATTASIAGSITAANLEGIVTVSGDAVYGETLTANYEGSAVSVAYQWYRDGDEISGAGGNTYTLTADDIGRAIFAAAISDDSNYSGSVESSSTGKVDKASQDAPVSGTGYDIDYIGETAAASEGYELAEAEDAQNGSISLHVTPGTNVYIRFCETATHKASGWTLVNVPERPDAPDVSVTAVKISTSVTVNAVSGQEYRIGENGIWKMAENGQVTFDGLTAGQSYTVYGRTAAADGTFASEISMGIRIMTLAEDGSGIVEDGVTITTGDGVQISNDGEKITITEGNTVTAITPVPEDGVSVNGEGSVGVPAGSHIQTGDGPKISIDGEKGVVSPDGSVILPQGGTATIEDKEGNRVTVTTPEGGGIRPDDNGNVEIPGGSIVETGSGESITIPEKGGTILPGGSVSYEVTVTFDSQGGSNVASQSVVNGIAASQPEEPTREGYAFQGWYTEKNGGSLWDFDVPLTEDMTLYARWFSTDAGIISVSVSGISGEIHEDHTITVALPYDTENLPADSRAVSITAAPQATVSQLSSGDGGRTWSFTVTAQDGTVQAYTIYVSMAEDPAAENKADVAAARSVIEKYDWTVPQTTANTESEIKAWIESQLADMNLNHVSFTVTMTDFVAAVSGTVSDTDGTDGSFACAIDLAKGSPARSTDSAYAADTVIITGVITASAYIDTGSGSGDNTGGDNSDSGSASGNNTGGSGSDAPKTGDDSQPQAVAVVMIAALGAIGAIFSYGRRKKKLD